MARARPEGELGAPTTDPPGAAEEEQVEIRPLSTHRELDVCVNLQRRIWGMEYGDIVPASILKVSKNVGGVVMGAFVRGDDPVGFVYGLTGVRDGHLTHWSHMLGVLRAHRGKGIGQRLKLRQKEWVLKQGVTEMRWTFDPLMAANAHFNLNLLGVDIHRYVPDIYRETGSALHSFGTDRLIAHWDLAGSSDGDAPDRSRPTRWEAAPILASSASREELSSWASGRLPEEVRIEIPCDILAVNRADPDEAMAWRRATRQAFLDSWDEGYRVVGFTRSKDEGRCHYLLLRENGTRQTAG